MTYKKNQNRMDIEIAWRLEPETQCGWTEGQPKFNLTYLRLEFSSKFMLS